MHTPSHIIITVKQAAKNSNITYSMKEYGYYTKITASSLVKLLLLPSMTLKKHTSNTRYFFYMESVSWVKIGEGMDNLGHHLMRSRNQSSRDT